VPTSPDWPSSKAWPSPAAARIQDVQGRLEDLFGCGHGVQVHPHVFRSALSREPAVNVRAAAALERTATGKLRRFVPLPPGR
jgi:hypothetical protein